MCVNLVLIVDDYLNENETINNRLGANLMYMNDREDGFTLYLLRMTGTNLIINIEYSESLNNKIIKISNNSDSRESYCIQCKEKNYIFIAHLGQPPTARQNGPTYIGGVSFVNNITNTRYDWPPRTEPIPEIGTLQAGYASGWTNLESNNPCIRISNLRQGIWEVLINHFFGNSSMLDNLK